jgi:metal-responsive CopG/Arc/MetJ family transcriptional regulator
VVARKPISVKLPPEIDDVVRSMPNRAEFLREVITKAVLEREQQ